MSKPLQPGLHIVATPIGNLGDLSPRAAATLRSCDLILAEDTRVTGKLLKHIESRVPTRRYDDHSTDSDRADIVERLRTDSIALVSDAGTPLISDPGYKLVRAARDAGRAVTTMPGPCAAIAALTLSGLPTDRFLFAGFLPAKAKARDDAISDLQDLKATLVFYESGPRLADSLSALANGLGVRRAAVAREITKLHEECVTGSLDELAARYGEAPPKGEIVIMVGPAAEKPPPSDADMEWELIQALQRQSPSRAAAEVAQRLGIPRKRVYARALELSRK